jgi:hypothetical protein
VTDDQWYLRGVDDALAEVQRRLAVDSKLGLRPSEYGLQRILDETSNRLHSGEMPPRAPGGQNT